MEPCKDKEDDGIGLVDYMVARHESSIEEAMGLEKGTVVPSHGREESNTESEKRGY